MAQTTCQFCSDADGAQCTRQALFQQEGWVLCRRHSDRNHRKKLPTTLVYALQSTDSNRTYVGATNDFARRLREHNCVVKNRGARYTRRTVVDATRPNWTPIFKVKGFPVRRQALQFEKLFHKGFRGRRLVTLPAKPVNPFGSSTSARRAWWLYWALKKERFSQQETIPTAQLSLVVEWSRRDLHAIATRLEDWGPATVQHILI